MIIMDLKMDNFCSFKDFHINFSYPKKVVNSYIENEYLPDRPNFRFKRINILMGANAVGKTSLGMMMKAIFNLIARQNIDIITQQIDNRAEQAGFSIDFIPDRMYRLYRVSAVFSPLSEMIGTTEGYKPGNIKVEVLSASIGKNDSYEMCIMKLKPDKHIPESGSSMEKLAAVPFGGWLFTHPMDVGAKSGTLGNEIDDIVYLEVLRKILMSLDPSIKNVEKSAEVDNSFIIQYRNKDIFVQDGEVVKDNILSSGTKAGIDIAGILTAMIRHRNTLYYCDEKFSYIGSDVEKAVLSVMAEVLWQNEQLFFTSHNSDLLDMPFPKHAFSFLRKTDNGEEFRIECVYASDFLKRNTDSMRNAVENDLFSISPDLGQIYELQNLDKKE